MNISWKECELFSVSIVSIQNGFGDLPTKLSKKFRKLSEFFDLNDSMKSLSIEKCEMSSNSKGFWFSRPKAATGGQTSSQKSSDFLQKSHIFFCIFFIFLFVCFLGLMNLFFFHKLPWRLGAGFFWVSAAALLTLILPCHCRNCGIFYTAVDFSRSVQTLTFDRQSFDATVTAFANQIYPVLYLVLRFKKIFTYEWFETQNLSLYFSVFKKIEHSFFNGQSILSKLMIWPMKCFV